MRTTIFSTPLLRPLLQAVARFLIALFGWKIVGDKPAHSKYVLIGAPHTSNWDFVLMLLFAFAKGLDVHWMGKHTLFPFPFAGLMRWLGGIAIDRRQRHGTVEQMIEHFHAREQLVLLITPEGTRQKSKQWKTGFYHIAVGAQVPIVLGFLDTQTRRMGLLSVFRPSGDIDSDLPLIQSRYRGLLGFNPDQQ